MRQSGQDAAYSNGQPELGHQGHVPRERGRLYRRSSPRPRRSQTWLLHPASGSRPRPTEQRQSRTSLHRPCRFHLGLVLGLPETARFWYILRQIVAYDAFSRPVTFNAPPLGGDQKPRASCDRATQPMTHANVTGVQRPYLLPARRLHTPTANNTVQISQNAKGQEVMPTTHNFSVTPSPALRAVAP